LNEIILDMKELTDSREMLEAKTHPFITWFIAILTLVLMAALIWSYFGQIDIVVKAGSVVRPNEQVSTINNKVFGQVDHVYVHSGQKVNQGDMLYTLSSQDLGNQLSLLQHNMNEAKQKLTHVQALKAAILQGTDASVGQSSASEQLKYLQNTDTDKNSLELQIQNTWNQLQFQKELLANSKLMEQSLAQNQNLFSSGSDYDYKYKNFEVQKKQYEVQVEQAQSQFKKTMLSGANPKEQRKQVDTAQLNLDSYVTQFHVNTQEDIQKAEQSVQSLQNQLSNLYVSLNTKIQDSSNEIVQLQNQLDGIQIQEQDRTIKAPIAGTLNIIQEINQGDVAQAGEEIATIIPKNNSLYEMQLAVSNQDIANIHVDDPVRFSFQALPQKEYGTLQGAIRYISPDAQMNQQNGVSYYVVRAAIENKPLFNKQGQETAIKVGMAAEAHIITRREKIIRLLLDKIKLGN